MRQATFHHLIPQRRMMGLLIMAFLFFSCLALSAQEQPSIESLLAPTGQAPSAPAATAPELPVETIDASPHLPGLPTWMTVLAVILVLAITIGLFILIQKFITASSPSRPPTMNPLLHAKNRLLALRDLPAETPLPEVSVQISLILRQYLAESKSDKALYQTREEFVTSEDRLRNLPPTVSQRTSDYLTELSSLKYAPPTAHEAQATDLIDRGLATLNAIASVEPEHSPLAAHD